MAHTEASSRDNVTAVDRASNDLLRRVPPHNVEAEQAVLGGIFIRNEVFHSLVDILTAEDFYLPAHQVLYTCFLDLYRKNAPIDLVSTAAALKDRGELETVGGASYLADLAQTVVGGANAEYYATIVRDKSLQRSLIGVCSSIISNCFDQTRSVDSLLDESEQAVFSVSERISGKNFRGTAELIEQAFDELIRRVNHKGNITGVTTGYNQLDNLTSGLQPSDLIIIAARPSMGKTAFALNIALRAATRENTPVGIYSLEMSTDQLIMRLISTQAKVELSRLRRGNLEQDDWNRLYMAAEQLKAAPIYIDDTPALTPLEMRARTRRLKAEYNIGMVMVDYLQLMRGARRTDSREQEISEISRSLKSLAKEMNIPVVALSQLNRKLEERADKRPQLSDLRESGAIEQDADVIMFIYRGEVYLSEEQKKIPNPHMGKAEIIIGKQRNGPTGKADLAFLSPYTAFEDLEPGLNPRPSETDF